MGTHQNPPTSEASRKVANLNDFLFFYNFLGNYYFFYVCRIKWPLFFQYTLLRFEIISRNFLHT